MLTVIMTLVQKSKKTYSRRKKMFLWAEKTFEVSLDLKKTLKY